MLGLDIKRYEHITDRTDDELLLKTALTCVARQAQQHAIRDNRVREAKALMYLLRYSAWSASINSDVGTKYGERGQVRYYK